MSAPFDLATASQAPTEVVLLSAAGRLRALADLLHLCRRGRAGVLVPVQPIIDLRLSLFQLQERFRTLAPEVDAGLIDLTLLIIERLAEYVTIGNEMAVLLERLASDASASLDSFPEFLISERRRQLEVQPSAAVSERSTGAPE